MQEKIIMFDGECVMCNNVITFILKHNKKQNLYFTTLQSKVAQDLLEKYDTCEDKNSVLYKNGWIVYSKSEAALQICKELHAPYSWLYICRYINLELREKIYNYIAKNRYRWFGKQSQCIIPTQENKHRFL